MIDQNLINQNIVALTTAVNNNEIINSQLRLIKNAFHQALILKLQEYFDQNYDNDLWVPETTEYGVPMDNIPRFKLTWEAESVIEELHEICQALTPLVIELYPDTQKKFNGIVIWRDHPGYDLAWHTDNPLIDVGLQIYLSGSPHNPGTEFKTGDTSLVLPFIPNTGYIVKHTGNRPVHRVAYPVPVGEVRYSLFAIWENIL